MVKKSKSNNNILIGVIVLCIIGGLIGLIIYFVTKKKSPGPTPSPHPAHQPAHQPAHHPAQPAHQPAHQPAPHPAPQPVTFTVKKAPSPPSSPSSPAFIYVNYQNKNIGTFGTSTPNPAYFYLPLLKTKPLLTVIMFYMNKAPIIHLEFSSPIILPSGPPITTIHITIGSSQSFQLNALDGIRYWYGNSGTVFEWNLPGKKLPILIDSTGKGNPIKISITQSKI